MPKKKSKSQYSPNGAARRHSLDHREADYKEVITSLDTAIRQHVNQARMLFVLAGLFAVAGVALMTVLFVRDIHAIDEAIHPELVMIFITLKSAAIAGLITAVVYGTLALARAALDQVTRFQKRLSSARFLHYVMDANDEQLRRSKVDLDTVMKFMESWTANVESAYTHVRIGPGRQQNIRFLAGSTGFAVEQVEPPAERKKRKKGSETQLVEEPVLA